MWDGRFEIAVDAPGWRVAALAGHAARLPPSERRAVAALPAAARPMLPVLIDPAGAPRLPRPFGDGPAEARSLVGARLRMAAGAAPTEADLAREAACTGPAASYPRRTPPCR
ncbi:MAG: hypothetical protein INR64_05905 [Caulobacteraceae bacterium]|nr:hypothetical protein [Caulobacter sp.]